MNNRQRGRARWLAGAAAIGFSASGVTDLRAESWSLAYDCVGIERKWALGEFAFYHDGVLGTSMELIVQAPRIADAGECERRVLGAIERLRRILSTYDPASEIRRVMAGGAVESVELAEVLAAYSLWGGRTGGAIELNMAVGVGLGKGAAAGA